MLQRSLSLLLEYGTIYLFQLLLCTSLISRGVGAAFPSRRASPEAVWCGKPYRPGSPSIAVGGQFPIPKISKVPLLNFQCWPGLSPFIHGEDTQGTIIIDAAIADDMGVPLYVPAGKPATGGTLEVTITIDVASEQRNGHNIVLNQHIPINSTATVPFLFPSSLTPNTKPYSVSCVAKNAATGEEFTASADLLYLPPNPYGGAAIKMDLLTGAFLGKPTGGGGSKASAAYGPIFPFGFYTDYGATETNLDLLNTVKSEGYNVVHLVPPFDGVLPSALDRMEELGLWVIYDMRWTFMNLTSVEAQVKAVRSRPNMLTYYTGDEPDGAFNPFNQTYNAATLIKALDPYHPVSVTLNCQDFYFNEYTKGAEIAMFDVYPVGIDAKYSTQYNTPCNATYGCCGCDNCVGTDIGVDIANRATEFKQRARWMGQERSLQIWSVPQAFGNDTFWTRNPTGDEFAVMSLIAIIHGARGIDPWIYPTTTSINTAASSIAIHVLPAFNTFLFAPGVRYTLLSTLSDTFHVASWAIQRRTLYVVANAVDKPATRTIVLGVGAAATQESDVERVFSGGVGNSVKIVSGGKMSVTLGGTGSLVFAVNT